MEMYVHGYYRKGLVKGWEESEEWNEWGSKEVHLHGVDVSIIPVHIGCPLSIN